jgi:glutathione synthase/RimK-type ligase-like ATP-grasp enzyme
MATYFLAKSRSTAISGLEIAGLLGTKIITPRTFLTRVRYGDTIINWGRSFTITGDAITALRWRNPPYAVKTSSHKLKTLSRLRACGVATLDFTTNKEEAEEWYSRVFVRHLLRASSGRGIEVVQAGDPLPYAQLYTKGFPKEKEYRAHVGGGQLFFLQQKRLGNSDRRPATRVSGVRNYANGWIFAHQNVDEPLPGLRDLAVRAVLACGLDFGAVDVLVNREGRAVVCEVNSAPAVSGATVDAYVSFFRSII